MSRLIRLNAIREEYLVCTRSIHEVCKVFPLRILKDLLMLEWLALLMQVFNAVIGGMRVLATTVSGREETRSSNIVVVLHMNRLEW